MKDKIFSLRSKFFSTNLTSSISDVFTKDSYSDVTLVSDDLIQFKSHKCVLSSCSPVLKNLLLNNPHYHPLIFPRGIKQQELGSILQFIYLGEARFYEGNMDMFMEAVKDLQIKQLTEYFMTPFLNRKEITKRVKPVIRSTRAIETKYEKVGENSGRSRTERLIKATMQNSKNKLLQGIYLWDWGRKLY